MIEFWYISAGIGLFATLYQLLQVHNHRVFHLPAVRLSDSLETLHFFGIYPVIPTDWRDSCWMLSVLRGSEPMLTCPITLSLTHRFRWYATLENKTPAETFPKFPSCLACYRQIVSKSTNHSPLTRRKEGQKVTLVAVIGGFRSDLSITRKIDGNFGNVSVGVLFSKVAYQRKRWSMTWNIALDDLWNSSSCCIQCVLFRAISFQAGLN